MNGDLQGKVARVTRELQQLKYPGAVDEVGLKLGDPVALLPALHFVLLKFSRHVAECIHLAGYELQGKTDQKFVELAFRLFRDCFSIKTVLTATNFLEQGFAERKLILLSDVIHSCKKIHNDALRKERLAALKSSKRGPGIETRLHEPKRISPIVKVVKAGKESRHDMSTVHQLTGSDRGQAKFKASKMAEPFTSRPLAGGSQYNTSLNARNDVRAAEGAIQHPICFGNISHSFGNAWAHDKDLNASLPVSNSQPWARTDVISPRGIGNGTRQSDTLLHQSHLQAAPQTPGLELTFKPPTLASLSTPIHSWFINPAYKQSPGGINEGFNGNANGDDGTTVPVQSPNPYLQFPTKTSASIGSMPTAAQQPHNVLQPTDQGQQHAHQQRPSRPVYGVLSSSSDDDSDDDHQDDAAVALRKHAREATQQQPQYDGQYDENRKQQQQLETIAEHDGDDDSGDDILQQQDSKFHNKSILQHAVQRAEANEAASAQQRVAAVDHQLAELRQLLKDSEQKAEQARVDLQRTCEALQARVTVLEGRVRHLECELEVCVRKGEYQSRPAGSPEPSTKSPPNKQHAGSPNTISLPATQPSQVPFTVPSVQPHGFQTHYGLARNSQTATTGLHLTNPAASSHARYSPPSHTSQHVTRSYMDPRVSQPSQQTSQPVYNSHTMQANDSNLYHTTQTIGPIGHTSSFAVSQPAPAITHAPSQLSDTSNSLPGAQHSNHPVHDAVLRTSYKAINMSGQSERSGKQQLLVNSAHMPQEGVQRASNQTSVLAQSERDQQSIDSLGMQRVVKSDVTCSDSAAQSPRETNNDSSNGFTLETSSQQQQQGNLNSHTYAHQNTAIQQGAGSAITHTQHASHAVLGERQSVSTAPSRFSAPKPSFQFQPNQVMAEALAAVNDQQDVNLASLSLDVPTQGNIAGQQQTTLHPVAQESTNCTNIVQQQAETGVPSSHVGLPHSATIPYIAASGSNSIRLSSSYDRLQSYLPNTHTLSISQSSSANHNTTTSASMSQSWSQRSHAAAPHSLGLAYNTTTSVTASLQRVNELLQAPASLNSSYRNNTSIQQPAASNRQPQEPGTHPAPHTRPVSTASSTAAGHHDANEDVTARHSTSELINSLMSRYTEAQAFLSEIRRR